MRKQKWTPGPWLRGKHGSIKDANGEIVEATGLALVTGYRNASDPAFANAQLIAAAPELYEVLDMMAVICPSETKHERECLKKARATLAKARGES